jgi:hypothetical protein
MTSIINCLLHLYEKYVLKAHRDKPIALNDSVARWFMARDTAEVDHVYSHAQTRSTNFKYTQH